MCILNLTQHLATADQIAAGVVDLEHEYHQKLQSWLTFSGFVSVDEITNRSKLIADFAHGFGYSQVMIGGALWLMAPLTNALYQRGITPLFAFSERETEEKSLGDGSVVKVMRFKHQGFITAVDLLSL